MILETLKRHWWVPVLRGIVAIVFGVIAFAYPGLTLAVLVIFFGAWVLVDGIFRVVGAIAGRSSDSDWGFQLIIGIIGIIIGVITFRAPQITALALLIYIAAWALMIGASEIALAIRLRKEIKGESAHVESCSRRSCFDLAHRILRNRVRSAGDLFWFQIAQPAHAASSLSHLINAVAMAGGGSYSLLKVPGQRGRAKGESLSYLRRPSSNSIRSK